ncbi:hypothetical protein IAU60_002694 [Kwoniella sp. DSM 27419]
MSLPSLQLGSRPFQLAYRLSTPSRSGWAERIDPTYPTVLFCHPIWLDSFFFYPQYDDPLLRENYNLLCFDMPVHGSSRVLSTYTDGYTWKDHAQVVIEALAMLDIDSVHLVGASRGGLSAMYLAVLRPDLTQSLILVTPPARIEPMMYTEGYKESLLAIRNSIMVGDLTAIQSLTYGGFELCTARLSDPVIAELRDDYMHWYSVQLAAGELQPQKILSILGSLGASRVEFPSELELKGLTCPKLVLRGSEEGWEDQVEDDEWASMAEEQGGDVVRRVLPSMPRWMTLTNPDAINPLIDQFITQRSVPLASEVTSQSGPHRPRIPRESSQATAPPGHASQGRRRTVADLIEEQHNKGEPDQGVNIEVEVLVRIDSDEGAAEPAVPMANTAESL